MIVDGKATMSANIEISKMLYKLRDLVPGIPANCTKLEIMQHVIDYISFLETVLEENGGQPSAELAMLKSTFQQHQPEMVN